MSIPPSSMIVMLGALILTLVGCQTAPGPQSETCRACSARSRLKGGPPEPMESGAEAAMRTFQRALMTGDASAALAVCSPEVQSAAGKYASAEAFIHEVVPIEQITLIDQFPICTLRELPGSKGKSYYGSFVRLVQAGEAGSVDWLWGAEKAPQGWQVTFEATPLAQLIEQEVARDQERTRQRLTAIRKLLPKLQGIHTRLTASADKYRLSEPILLRLELINDGATDLRYDHQQVAVNGSLRVTDADGHPVAYAPEGYQTIGGYTKLQVGQRAVLFDRLNLIRDYPIKKPGRYAIQYRGSGLSILVHDPDLPYNPDDFHPQTIGAPCIWPSNVVFVEVVP